MRNLALSRRRFVALAASGLLPSKRTGATPQVLLSAQQVIDRIRTNLGVPWRDKTIDGFKAGDPAETVTGIMLTVMTTCRFFTAPQ